MGGEEDPPARFLLACHTTLAATDTLKSAAIIPHFGKIQPRTLQRVDEVSALSLLLFRLE